MADTVTLGAVTEALTYEAGIDGKTGSNARHDTDALYALINRQYKQLRSLVSQNGEEFFRTRTAAAAIPSRSSGEDYIAVTFPTDASEIIGVDIQLSDGWHSLTASSWPQRRVFPGVNRIDSPGEWTTISMPQPSTTTTTAGQIAIWPPYLSGSYVVDYLPHWVPITNPSHVFVVFPHWEEWLLCSCTMAISQRDNDKRRMYEIARDRKGEAQGQILLHCRRSKRGTVVARRRDGLEL